MRPEEVLDAQGDLLDRLADVRFATNMTAMTTQPSIPGHDPFQARAANFEWVQHTLIRGAREAHTYKVSHDMGMVVEHAADVLDGTDQIDLRLPPTDAGLVCFDRPFPIVDVRGYTMLAHWLMWVPATVQYADVESKRVMDTPVSGLALFWWNDLWRQPDDIDGVLRENHGEKGYEQYRAISGRWATVGMDHVTAGQRLGPAFMDMPDSIKANILAQSGVEARKGANQVRLAHALWLMLNQTIAHQEHADLPRATKRRAAKRKLPGSVTVIRLRREEPGAERHEGESLVEWAHRWIVRGHWRWAHVSPHHPQAVEVSPGDYRARVWVNGHVKGPDGAPFKQTRKVNVLDR